MIGSAPSTSFMASMPHMPPTTALGTTPLVGLVHSSYDPSLSHSQAQSQSHSHPHSQTHSHSPSSQSHSHPPAKATPPRSTHRFTNHDALLPAGHENDECTFNLTQDAT